MMGKYIKIMRLDHWIKQLFILPGCLFAVVLLHVGFNWKIINLLFGFIAVCLIASANYVINEWLDAEFDKYHPTKKYRQVVSGGVKGYIVWILWGVLTICGLGLALLVNIQFMCSCALLWLMGLIYNVKPVRTKDIPYLDVISESVNNAIRLVMGWLIVSGSTLPPCSIVLGYWMVGAFLMATKRFSEYRMIDDPATAGLYRKSFQHYTEKSLMLSAFVYAMSAVFFVGIFLIKYRIEFVLLIPGLVGLFCYYFHIAYKQDSAAQKPEKLYKEKGLMIYVFLFIMAFVALLFIDIPWLDIFVSNNIIAIS